MEKRNLWSKIGIKSLILVMVLGTLLAPSISADNMELTKASVPNAEAKIDSSIIPRGANMDELVEVIIQFEGEPVLTSFSKAKAAGKKLSKEEQQGLATALQKGKTVAKGKVESSGGKIIASYDKVYNGLYVQLKKKDILDIAKLNNVTGIYSVQAIEFMNESSVPFIGAPEVWEQVVDGVNVTGAGVTVAVIDTGIDYTHAAFGGPGTKESFENNDPAIVEDGTFPTSKVVGGYDLVGTNYNASASNPSLRVPLPDDDPMDEHAHGTHVAGTIAGFEVEGKIGKGVAPDALLYAYKVFGESGSTGVVALALEMAADPNGDGDVSDHVDVVNMSVGSPYGHPDDPSAVATNNAVEAGIIVVASAGNSGNIPYITGSPAVAEKAISVAASIDDGIVVGAIRVNSPETIVGDYEAVEGAITIPLSEAGPVTNNVSYVGRGCINDEYGSDPNGKIALIDRGACTFTEKLTRALEAGAVAAIVANNSAGDPITMGGSNVEIPGVMISKATGQLMKDALANGAVNLTLSADIRIPKPHLADTIAGFSSKGPGRPDTSFKPDVSAPGFDIYSAAIGSGDGGRLMSGTSMAAPHVAGVAALLKQLHPEWTTDEIKSLIMNTSTSISDLNDEVYPLSRQGAGRVQVDVAANTSSVVYPQALGLGYVPVSEESVTKEVSFTVTNKSEEEKTYSLSWQNRHGNTGGAVSVSIPETVTVGAGESGDVTASITFDASALPNNVWFNEQDGYIILIDNQGEVLHVPYQAIVQKVSEVSAGEDGEMLSLTNNGVMDSETTLYRLDAVDGAEDNIPDDYDLRAIGSNVDAKSGIAEFAVATESNWATPNTIQFNILVDSDMDNNPDWLIFNYDWYALYGLDPIGIQISVGYNLNTGALYPMYFANGGTWNSSVMGLPASLGLINSDGDDMLQYMVYSWGAESALPDMNDNGWIKLNINQPGIDFDSSHVSVPAGETIEMNVDFISNAKSVLILNTTDEGDSQHSIVTLDRTKGNKGK